MRKRRRTGDAVDIVIGGIGAGLIPVLPEGQSADTIVPILYSEFFPAGGMLLTVAAFAAAMSTMGSQILTSGLLFVHDIVNRTRIFETGYSTTDERTGFGHSIVKQIADAHD